MAQLIVTTFLSLDGVMEAPGGGDHPHAGWTFRDVAFDMAAYAIKGRETEEATALLLGRRSYDEFAPVWPTMEEFAHYNAIPKYVVSTTLDDSPDALPWNNSHLLRSLEDVADLKASHEGQLQVHGSADLAQGLAAAGLVDRYHLLTFPLLLGGGKRLFGGDADGAGGKQKLRLVEHAAYGNGITLGVYDVER